MFSSPTINTLHFIKDVPADNSFISLAPETEKIFMPQFTKCCSTYLEHFKKTYLRYLKKNKFLHNLSAIQLPQLDLNGIKPMLNGFPK